MRKQADTEAPVVINSGAWQHTITPYQAEGVMKDRSWSVAEMLRQLGYAH